MPRLKQYIQDELEEIVLAAIIITIAYFVDASYGLVFTVIIAVRWGLYVILRNLRDGQRLTFRYQILITALPLAVLTILLIAVFDVCFRATNCDCFNGSDFVIRCFIVALGK